MPATDVEPHCPQCDGMATVAMSTGLVLCLPCQLEFDPAASPATVPTRAGDAAAEVVRELRVVEAGEPEHATAELIGELRARYVGRRALVVASNATGTVANIDADGITTVAMPDGTFAYLEPDEWTPLDPEPAIVDVTDPEALQLSSTVITLAGLVLSAGLASVAPEGADDALVFPPGGWCPDDADAIPAIEQAAAYAVSSLIVLYKLPREQIAELANEYATANQTNDDGDK